MYDKFFEQAQSAMKPMSDLMSYNAKVMEEMAEKQKAFVQEMMEDGMSYAKELSSQKDYSGIYQAQKTYMENLQSKWVAASTDAYELMASNQEKLSEVFKKATTVQ